MGSSLDTVPSSLTVLTEGEGRTAVSEETVGGLMLPNDSELDKRGKRFRWWPGCLPAGDGGGHHDVLRV